MQPNPLRKLFPELLLKPPIIAAIAVFAAACALGNWQLNRAHQRLDLAAASAAGEAGPPVVLGAAADAPADVAFHRVRAHGKWLPEFTVLLDNRPHGAAGPAGQTGSGLPGSAAPAAGQTADLDGRSGFEVVMPLALPGGGALLVKRGWIARDKADPTLVPQFATPQDEIEVEGVAVTDLGRVYALGNADETGRRIRQNLDLPAYAKELAGKGLRLLPFALRQTSDAPDGLRRNWVRPGSGADRNYGYAFQWFALAAMTVVFAAFHLWRAHRKQQDNHDAA